METLSNSPTLYLACVGILGLLFGSFFNVVIHRLPRMMHCGWKQQCRELLELENPEAPQELSLISPGSSCPACNSPIRAIENIPVLSYLFLGGRCRNCKTRISPRYPLVEILTAMLFILVAWRFGFSYQAIAGLVLTGMLVPLVFIDIDEQLLPDSITMTGLWIGILFNTYGVFTDLHSSVIGAIAGYLSLWSVYWLFKLLTGKEGMGHGDFKLLAMLGAWLGWQQLPLIILLSATVGAVLGILILAMSDKSRGTPIPFGPYLCMAGWIALVGGNEIIETYMSFSGLG